jgi:hypothetical protein
MESSKQFEADVHGKRFVLNIHTENPAHEARIRWKIPNQNLSGKWGRLYLPENMPRGGDQVIQEPTLTFGGHEPIMINGQERNSIELPRSLASGLQDSLDELGTATVDREHVCDDASRFPSTLQYRTQISTEHLDKMWWDSDRYLMWYAPEKPQAQNVPSRFAELISQLDLYGYQIEDEKLIHRTEEFPSGEAMGEFKQTLQQTMQNLDPQPDTNSHRIDSPLE